MLIDETYFMRPETYIAGIEINSNGRPAGLAPKLIADINAYIERLEPRFLRMLLGEEVAARVEDYPSILGLLRQPRHSRSVIAKYVYFYYSRDHATFNTVAGEKLKNIDMSTRTSPAPRLVALWNDMVAECWDIVNSIEDVEICPCFDADIFEQINIFNV